jgi:hypothetical protein
VLCEGAVVGRIMKAAASPVGTPWMWTLAYGHHEDRTPIYGYEPTREDAMAAFAKSWRRQMNENAPPTGKRAAGLSNRDGEVLPTPHALHFADSDGRIRTAMPPIL